MRSLRNILYLFIFKVLFSSDCMDDDEFFKHRFVLLLMAAADVSRSDELWGTC